MQRPRGGKKLAHFWQMGKKKCHWVEVGKGPGGSVGDEGQKAAESQAWGGGEHLSSFPMHCFYSETKRRLWRINWTVELHDFIYIFNRLIYSKILTNGPQRNEVGNMMGRGCKKSFGFFIVEKLKLWFCELGENPLEQRGVLVWGFTSMMKTRKGKVRI